MIIPCWNAGYQLKEAVESVRPAANGIHYEIIVVDDGSTDPDTYECLNQIEKTPHLKIIRLDENKGQSAARNLALLAAKFNFILPLDADDVLAPISSGKPGYMQQGMEILSVCPDTVITSCDTERFGAKEGKLLIELYNEKRFLYRNTVPAFGMYRCNEALSVGGYNEAMRHAEDYDFWITLLNHRHIRGERANVTKQAFTGHYYRQHTHGNNVSVLQKISRQEIYAQLIDHNPEIYHKHYSHISREALPAHLETQAKNIWRHAFACAANDPLTLCREAYQMVSGKLGLSVHAV